MHGRVRFRAMLVELDGALQLGDAQLKRHDGAEHFALVILGQTSPLCGVRRFVIPNELFEQPVFGLRLFH